MSQQALLIDNLTFGALSWARFTFLARSSRADSTDLATLDEEVEDPPAVDVLWASLYEIPIDSRITKWLNANGFPFDLASGALNDRAYYEFVSDGVQVLCEKSGVLPCVLDAAVFSSYDADGWTEDNLVW